MVEISTPISILILFADGEVNPSSSAFSIEVFKTQSITSLTESKIQNNWFLSTFFELRPGEIFLEVWFDDLLDALI